MQRISTTAILLSSVLAISLAPAVQAASSDAETLAELNSPLKKALLTGFHSTAKYNATKAVSPSSETMRTI